MLTFNCCKQLKPEKEKLPKASRLWAALQQAIDSALDHKTKAYI